MLSKKPLLWTLAVILILAAGGIVVQQRQRQATPPAEAAGDKKPQDSPGEKAEDKPEQKPKVTVLSAAAREHLAEKAFIAGLRAAFLWRSAQPAAEETRRAWLEKLAAIPSDDLSPERKRAWQTLLQAWQSLADPAQANDPTLKQQGRQAAEALNTMLREHGDGDLVF